MLLIVMVLLSVILIRIKKEQARVVLALGGLFGLFAFSIG